MDSSLPNRARLFRSHLAFPAREQDQWQPLVQGSAIHIHNGLRLLPLRKKRLLLSVALG